MHSRLRTVRKSLGLTQAQMATDISISKRAWQTYEEGKSTPGGKVLLSLVELGFNINWILTGDGPMTIEGKFKEAHIDMVKDVLLNDKDAAKRRYPAREVDTSPSKVSGSETSYSGPSEEIRISDKITKAVRVLESDTIYRTALASNIDAFHQAIEMERRHAAVCDRMTVMENKLAALEQLLAEKEEKEGEEKIEGEESGEAAA